MRKDKYIKEKGHDPYDERRKYPEGTFCPRCNAIYRSGRWEWHGEKVPKGEAHLCPACRRIKDNYPAGEVLLTGEYIKEHREEIVNLINNLLEEERGRSPLKRAMEFTIGDERIFLTLTDDHLARHIGEAVRRAHRGELKIKYGEESRFIRLHWHRDF